MITGHVRPYQLKDLSKDDNGKYATSDLKQTPRQLSAASIQELLKEKSNES